METPSFETQANNIEVYSTQEYVYPSYFRHILLYDGFSLMAMFAKVFFLG